ncbi:hypothetical protein CWI75_09300 [Kineobactrum sediminis]|uniref:Thioredoxin domain-containing protein n=1 Tax=Kineobactrum sediminis TaxID=1905677 RepID=A0A2N5Y301_9GAMM|nr:redoxin domain-containing protein [Kineobactrum sediminis]PLW82758.1 hypothetical protein CWI75_09300 [Kineobactrum sediminis]
MKRTLIMVTLAAVLLAALVYSLRAPLRQVAVDTLTADMFVPVPQDTMQKGPAPGSRFPGLRALHNGEEITLLEPFAGSRGTVLVASRSVEWCPYCMKEMVQLQAHKAAFDAAGVGLVALTYDAPHLQQAFADKHGITIPLLSDIDALSFKTLGILNTDYAPGDDHYGIPDPGMIVIAPDGTVAGTLFLDGYSRRVAADAALLFALEVLSAEAG